jgi:hypothetical protein
VGILAEILYEIFTKIFAQKINNKKMTMGLSNWLITIKRKLIFTLKTPKLGLVGKKGGKEKESKKRHFRLFKNKK